MEVYIGTICAFSFNYVPAGWLACDGSMQVINQYTALAAATQFIYGGSFNQGKFGLPNLNGCVAIGMSVANPIGQYGGSRTFILTPGNMPPHSHTIGVAIGCYDGTGNSPNPVGNYLAQSPGSGLGRQTKTFNSSQVGGVKMKPEISVGMGIAGVASPAPVNSLPPYQVTSYYIATNGYYPERG